MPKKNKAPSAIMYKLANTIKNGGTAVSIPDIMLKVLENRVDAIKNFQEEIMPLWANAIYYMVPSIIVFGLLIKDWVTRDPKETEPETDAAKEFIASMNRLPKTRKTLNENKEEKSQFHNMVHTFQYLGNNLTLDIILNAFVLTIRELHGFLFLLETMKIATHEKNQELTDITSDIYSIINALYISTMLIQKNFREKKTPVRPEFHLTATVVKAANRFKSLLKKAELRQAHDKTETDDIIDLESQRHAGVFAAKRTPLQTLGKFPKDIISRDLSEPLLMSDKANNDNTNAAFARSSL